jgi:type I restriction enzyme S subunit
MSEVNLPEVWLDTSLDDVLLSIVGGGTPSKSNASYFQGSIPWMSVKDMNKNTLEDTVDHITQEAVENSSTNVIPAGTPIVATRMSLGKIVVANFDSAINQDLKALFHATGIERDYLVNWYRANSKLIESLGTGTTVKGIRLEVLRALELPLPPRAEQKVIADKLDTLLALVETTKARLDRIPQILKTFRQSVLAAAVSGKLTEKWRDKNPLLEPISLDEIDTYWEAKYLESGKKRSNLKLIDSVSSTEVPTSWVNTNIGYVFDVYVGATPSRKSEDYWNGDVPWVSSSEVAFCRINSTKETVTKLGLAKTSTNIHPLGTVMLAMIGQGKTRGQVAILDIEACHNQNTAALRVPTNFVVSEYLYFYLTKQYEETRRVGGGNNQKALNKSFVQALEFPLPPFKEQTEIVRRVEELFAFADSIEQKANAALERVNNLTQSILAKAFRGELTADWRTANPELISGENSAEALLAKIKAEREGLSSKKQPKKKAAPRKKA